jgi:hypothetical protein
MTILLSGLLELAQASSDISIILQMPNLLAIVINRKQ